MNEIRASVVVPTYKRPQLLRNCLHALVRQQFPPEAYEIIIVDDGPSEETRALVESFSGTARQSNEMPVSNAGPEVCYVEAAQTQGPAAARNIGWRMARGEIVAFTDDDCLPEPDWLREGLAAFDDELAGISGRVVVPIADLPTDYEKNVSRLATCEFVTASCFCRRSALEASGGFDERFTMAWREDSDLQFKLLTLSYKLGMAPQAKVIHPVRPAPWGVCIKEQHKSMFDALLFKKYPDLYRDRIASGPPLRYYGIILSTFGFLLGLVMRNLPLAVLMAATWIGLVAHFSWLRLRETKHTPGHIAEMVLTSCVIPYLSVFWRLYGAVSYRVFFF